MYPLLPGRSAKKLRVIPFLQSIGLLLGMLYSSQVHAQDYLKSFKKELTPSPMVANLGAFGGINIKKNTGGVSKSISLFEFRQGGVSYIPSIDYFSTGLKVNDWGSRVGMGWTEQITAVISRTVRGVPDERATSRIGDGEAEFGTSSIPDYSQASYVKIRDMAAPGTTVDGQYDLYNFNIFGKSGQFIIRNNQAVLLTDDNSFKIDIIAGTPIHKFILTDITGGKYYFDGQTEGTKFDQDNACDIDNPYRYGLITTGWFINKVVAPGGSTVNFNYDYVEYSYIYDYDESYLFHYFPNPNWYFFTGLDPYPNKSSCVRRKNTRTYILSSVTGDYLNAIFEYDNRNDIYNEKLLRRISFYNGAKQLRRVDFTYDAVAATSTIEPALDANLLVGPAERSAIKLRYFLKELDILNGLGTIEQAYKFGYLDPSPLPHRFSFAQDYMGCYNAKGNSGLVPVQAKTGLQMLPTSTIAFADRNPVMAGSAGLLREIEYPTGGKEVISYEQNQYTTILPVSHPITQHDWLSTEESTSYIGWFFTMTVPRLTEVELVLECYTDDPDPDVEDEKFAKIELWSTDGKMTFPIGWDQVDLIPGQSFNSTRFNHDGQGNNLKMIFEPEKEYNLYLTLQGKYTGVRAWLTYNEITNERSDPYYAGYRIKKVVSSSGTSPDVVKSYKYNTFTKSGDAIEFTDVSSLVCIPMKDYSSWSVNVVPFSIPDQYPNLPPGQTDLEGNIAYNTFKLLPNSNNDISRYGGLPYSYTNVTEFLDNNETSYIASEFNITVNDYASRILIDQFPNMPVTNPLLDNTAWDHGFEINRYLGTRIDNVYKIDLEKKWNYSVTSGKYYNYSSHQLHTIYGLSTDPRENIVNYIAISNPLYRHWVKLNDVTETNYSRVAGGYNTLSNKIIYRYNTTDKFLEEEEITNSKKQVALKQIFRPTKMVALGRDPQGIYQGMINNHVVAPEIEVINKVNQNQVGLVRTNYFQPFTGLYVPQSIQTQRITTDPLVTQLKYLRYDDRGNVLSLSRDEGTVVNYIWSYKGNHPVAEIANCNYSTVESTLGATALTNFRNLAPVRTDVDALIAPLKTAVPGAFFKKYSYEPLVGVRSITDPRDQITYYEYDDFQRLRHVADHQGNIIKKLEYHYKN